MKTVGEVTAKQAATRSPHERKPTWARASVASKPESIGGFCLALFLLMTSNDLFS